MNPISNPALVPPGNLGPSTPVAPPVAPRRTGGTPAAPPGAPNQTGGTPAAPPGAARTAGGVAAPAPAAPTAPAPSFAEVLAHAGAGRLQFSKHALARVERRGIELGAGTLGRLSQGVDRAASKGSRDSLVLVDGTAFVVSVSNRTVITAVGSEHMKDNVFTNIDSAVIA
jgi:flagellar operon protein